MEQYRLWAELLREKRVPACNACGDRKDQPKYYLGYGQWLQFWGLYKHIDARGCMAVVSESPACYRTLPGRLSGGGCLLFCGSSRWVDASDVEP